MLGFWGFCLVGFGVGFVLFCFLFWLGFCRFLGGVYCGCCFGVGVEVACFLAFFLVFFFPLVHQWLLLTVCEMFATCVTILGKHTVTLPVLWLQCMCDQRSWEVCV